jgi:chromosome condensin MukBEF complex kleisin-like MukF subunit
MTESMKTEVFLVNDIFLTVKLLMLIQMLVSVLAPKMQRILEFGQCAVT